MHTVTSSHLSSPPDEVPLAYDRAVDALEGGSEGMNVLTSGSELDPPGWDSGWQGGSDRSKTRRRRTEGAAEAQGHMVALGLTKVKRMRRNHPDENVELRAVPLAHLSREKKINYEKS